MRGSRCNGSLTTAWPTLETDDEIAGGECIASQLHVKFETACDAVEHYQKALCALAVSRGTYPDTVDVCLGDPAFVGPTVRRNGGGG